MFITLIVEGSCGPVMMNFIEYLPAPMVVGLNAAHAIYYTMWRVLAPHPNMTGHYKGYKNPTIPATLTYLCSLIFTTSVNICHTRGLNIIVFYNCCQTANIICLNQKNIFNYRFMVLCFRIQKELAEITLDPPPNCR